MSRGLGQGHDYNFSDPVVYHVRCFCVGELDYNNMVLIHMAKNPPGGG